MERAKPKSIAMPVRHLGETSAKVSRGVSGGDCASTRALSFPPTGASESAVQAWQADNAPFPPTELLKIAEVEDRTHMRQSNIYRLIQLGQFPAPIHLGGSKWIAAEIHEYIARKQDERDRQRGKNKFAPRPESLTGQGPALNGSIPGGKQGWSAIPPPSTVRMLSPELCEALRLLRVDIPELYLDPATCNVSLAVVKVDLSPASPERKDPNRKKR